VDLSAYTTALLLPCGHGLGQRPPQNLLQTEVVCTAGEDVTKRLKQPLVGPPKRLQARSDRETQLSHMDFPANNGIDPIG
jgi:hypothetical protein